MLSTIRTLSLETRDFIKTTIEEENLPKFIENLGGSCEISPISYGYPPVINNASMTKLVEENIVDLFGQNAVELMNKPRMDVEDVSYLLNEIPGCFFRLGTKNEAKNMIYDHHHPKFKIDRKPKIRYSTTT